MYPAGATAGAGAGAAAAAVVHAIKASGALVRVDPEAFQRILNQGAKVLVVGTGRRSSKYAVAHGGFVFWTKSKEEPMLPGGILRVETKSLWMPA